MTTSVGMVLVTSVLVAATDAAAQTLPPANSFMGPLGIATMHATA